MNFAPSDRDRTPIMRTVVRYLDMIEEGERATLSRHYFNKSKNAFNGALNYIVDECREGREIPGRESFVELPAFKAETPLERVAVREAHRHYTTRCDRQTRKVTADDLSFRATYSTRKRAALTPDQMEQLDYPIELGDHDNYCLLILDGSMLYSQCRQQIEAWHGEHPSEMLIIAPSEDSSKLVESLVVETGTRSFLDADLILRLMFGDLGKQARVHDLLFKLAIDMCRTYRHITFPARPDGLSSDHRRAYDKFHNIIYRVSKTTGTRIHNTDAQTIDLIVKELYG